MSQITLRAFWDRFALTSAVLALASKVFDAHVSPDSQISALDRTARLFG